MVKKNSKKNNKKMSQGGKKGKVQNALKPQRLGSRGDSYRQSVLRMWADPCTSDMVRPPYAGMDSGYMVRTVDEISINVSGFIGLTPGVTIVPSDVLFQWTPSNYGSGTGYVVGSNATGSSVNVSSNNGPGNFMLHAAVRDFRPAASCIQWVPSGAIGVRSGIVSSFYSPSTELVPGQAYSTSQVSSLCQHSEGNAAGHYEVNWLPTLSDERFTTSIEGNLTGRGTCTVALRAVDSTATSPTTTQLNGYFRVTTIWEWTPSVTSGMCLDPVPPVPHTTQAILGGIKNIRDIIYGVKHIGGMLGLGFGANSGPRLAYPAM